jgi:predicted glycosyltransferase
MNLSVWVDYLTPKQVLFFRSITEKLEKDGFEIIRTTREYSEVIRMLELTGTEARVIGRHGGRSLKGKLIASAERIIELAKYISTKKIACALGFASPELSRVALGIAIPHFTVNDSPHSIAVARLTSPPLSERLFTPEQIPISAWLKIGVPRDQITQYNGLDPIAWLKGFAPNNHIVEELGLNQDQPIIVARTEEKKASYLLDLDPHQISIIVPIIKKISQEYPEFQIVVIPRYDKQYLELRKALGEEIAVLDKAIDGASLLAFSSLFIGAGGTMNAEAALLGVPTISCYPKETTHVEQFLINEGAIYRAKDETKAIEKTKEILSAPEEFKEQHKLIAERLLTTMDDPSDVIIEHIEKFLTKKS